MSRAGTEYRANVATGIVKRVALVVIFLAVVMAILLGAAGRFGWLWAWVYLAISVVSSLITGAVTIRASPETVAERGEMKLAETWDKTLSILYMLSLFVALPLVAGLDERFDWTTGLSSSWQIAGAAVYALGLALSSWAMIANAYFSTAVRIQSDRGHAVCSSGPYRFVRHPGYVGFILSALGEAVLLGSLWALIPGAAAATCMAIRTAFEDRMLHAELPGYRDYARRVRFRLLPRVW